MNINYTDSIATGFRIAIMQNKSLEYFPASHHNCLATYEDATEVLVSILRSNKLRKSFTSFRIDYFEHGRRISFD